MKGPVCFGERHKSSGGRVGSRLSTSKFSSCSLVPPNPDPRAGCPRHPISSPFCPPLTESPFYGQAPGNLSYWSSLGQRSCLLPARSCLGLASPSPGQCYLMLALVINPTTSTKAQGPQTTKLSSSRHQPRRCCLQLQKNPSSWLASLTPLGHICLCEVTETSETTQINFCLRARGEGEGVVGSGTIPPKFQTP